MASAATSASVLIRRRLPRNGPVPSRHSSRARMATPPTGRTHAHRDRGCGTGTLRKLASSGESLCVTRSVELEGSNTPGEQIGVLDHHPNPPAAAAPHPPPATGPTPPAAPRPRPPPRPPPPPNPPAGESARARSDPPRAG